MRSGQGSSKQATTIGANAVYNRISVLAHTRYGLAAYSSYERDGSANAALWQERRQHDEQAARRLLKQLEQVAQQDKLGANEPRVHGRRGRCGRAPYRPNRGFILKIDHP